MCAIWANIVIEYTYYMTLRMRRAVGVVLVMAGIGIAIYQQQIAPQLEASREQQGTVLPAPQHGNVTDEPLAISVLETIPVKGRAPKTGYKREQFGDGWNKQGECDMRNIILHRDLNNVTMSDSCKVISGSLADPYTGKTVLFQRGEQTSDDVQIDHIVALSNAWQTGAQQLTLNERVAMANDPLELVAVDGDTNQKKGDGDAATWLPPNKPFRCQYVARQIAVKSKYKLWVTQAEGDAMRRVLASCPNQQLPTPTPSYGNN